MMLPEADEAREEIGSAQEGAVGRGCASNHDMVTASRSGMTAIEHELLRPKAALARFFIEGARALDEFSPTSRRVNVHLDHSGVRSHLKSFEAPVVGWLVSLDDHLKLRPGCGFFDRGE